MTPPRHRADPPPGSRLPRGRLAAEVDDPLDLYAALASAQSGAFNCLIVTGEHTVVSASPELFFERTGDQVVTRPMKGTAPRGRWPEDDLARGRALQASEKERAENVMIVDVMRNDLGRVATAGTVKVPALFEIERYPTLWQLTSTVTARLAPDTDLADLFAALFPSGSVTGAPKRAAMKAIAFLEQRPRGVYCGAVGYLSPDPRRPPGPVLGRHPDRHPLQRLRLCRIRSRGRDHVVIGS